MDISKNRQEPRVIREIMRHALGLDTFGIRELTAGQCNALYAVTLSDRRDVVLKIAAQAGLRRGEQWLMTGEVEAMKAVRETGLPVPEILFEDLSGETIGIPLFIMEYMPGVCLGTVCRSWSSEEKADWYRKIGQTIAQISQIRHDTFGIVSSPEQFFDLFSFYRHMLGMLFADAADLQVNLGAEPQDILALLDTRSEIFREVGEPCLVHYDIWENNLMGQEGSLCGILDWERAIWGEPLMEERFRSYAVNRALCEGFGKTEFTLAESERMLWYDLLMDAALMVDVFARQYESTAQYDRAKARFVRSFAALQQPIRVFVPEK